MDFLIEIYKQTNIRNKMLMSMYILMNQTPERRTATTVEPVVEAAFCLGVRYKCMCEKRK